MSCQCWSTVYDVGPTLTQHRISVSCLLDVTGGILYAGIPPSANGSIRLWKSKIKHLFTCKVSRNWVVVLRGRIRNRIETGHGWLFQSNIGSNARILDFADCAIHAFKKVVTRNIIVTAMFYNNYSTWISENSTKGGISRTHETFTQY